MRGDFSRLALDGRTYSQVLMQQGRVLVDADWNAAGAALLAAQRALAADLVGPHAGPAGNVGFEIATTTTDGRPDLLIGPGAYWVDGVRCAQAADAPVAWSAQPDPPFLAGDPADRPDLPDAPFLAYLDVWERLVTSLDDDSLREVALGGADTTARSEVVWQVRVASVGGDGNARLRTDCPKFPLDAWRTELAGSPPLLRVWSAEPADDETPCPVGPDTGYRGAENQLYRVEIIAVEGTAVAFAWSRENASVVAAWTGTAQADLQVSGVRDRHRGFGAGDWVQLSWDGHDAAGLPGTLAKVVTVDGSTVTIDPKGATGPIASDPAALPHAVVRRWDQRERKGQKWFRGGVAVAEVSGDDDRQPLEDGIAVQFVAPPDGALPHTYRVGDFWTFPARVATGTVEWPVDDDRHPLALPPQGPVHHYAPLGWLGTDGKLTELRRRLKPATECVK